MYKSWNWINKRLGWGLEWEAKLLDSFFFLIYLAVRDLSCGTQDLCCSLQTLFFFVVFNKLWHAGSSFLTRDGTQATDIRSMES